jgi:hypothetical protein
MRRTDAVAAVPLKRRRGLAEQHTVPDSNLATARPTDSRTELRSRVAGQAVMAELLRQQQARAPRSLAARILGRSPLTAESVPWFRGALGERRVGELLGRLDSSWRVLHAVPVGAKGSDIDHVVIGPGGVFTINTKNHAGQDVWVANRTFMINGRRTPHIRVAEHEAERAAAALTAAVGVPVAVKPIIAVVDPRKLIVRELPATVQVLPSGQLLRWLRTRTAVLSERDVDVLSAAAAQPAIWSAKPVPDEDPSAVAAAFRDVEDQVRSARRAQGAWTLGTVATAVVGVLTVGQGMAEHVLSVAGSLLP